MLFQQFTIMVCFTRKQTVEFDFISIYDFSQSSLVAQTGKNLPAMWETWVWYLGLIPGLGRFPWRRAWQATPVFLPGESHGQRSLAGYRPWKSQTRLSDSAQHSTWLHSCLQWVWKWAEKSQHSWNRSPDKTGINVYKKTSLSLIYISIYSFSTLSH